VIVLDTSALMTMVLNEPQAKACEFVIADTDEVLISAGTLTETLIVAGARGLEATIRKILTETDTEVVSVDYAMALLAAQGYSLWGKGNHPARLNYGDCFAYALAKERQCPLLFIGNDFSQTDIESAL
jgi:ribonuclease VapC